jgi:hypothetical protein
MVKLGILVDENGQEVDWSDLTEAQKGNFEEEHDIIPPKENTNATSLVEGASDVSASPSPSPTSETTIAQLDPSSVSQQPPVHGMYHIPHTFFSMVYTLVLSNNIDDMLRSDYEFSSHPYRIPFYMDRTAILFVWFHYT